MKIIIKNITIHKKKVSQKNNINIFFSCGIVVHITLLLYILSSFILALISFLSTNKLTSYYLFLISVNATTVPHLYSIDVSL